MRIQDELDSYLLAVDWVIEQGGSDDVAWRNLTLACDLVSGVLGVSRHELLLQMSGRGQFPESVRNFAAATVELDSLAHVSCPVGMRGTDIARLAEVLRDIWYERMLRKTWRMRLHAHRFAWFAAIVGIVVGSFAWYAQYQGSLALWDWRAIRFYEFKVMRAEQGWGSLKRNEGLNGETLMADGQVYLFGLATHAESNIRIRLRRNTKMFFGYCIYPDYVSGARIQCSIEAGRQVLWRSAELNAGKRKDRFDINLSRYREVTLRIRSLDQGINAAHGAWVDFAVNLQE